MNKSSLLEKILTELNTIFTENKLPLSDLNENTILFGAGSAIDSLDLVGLIVTVEEFVLEKTGKEIQVIDEESIIAEGKSPFRSVSTLADLVLEKAHEK